MAVKTFSAGEQLTASDTNTYLANAGLVVVTPSSVSGGTLSGAKVTIGSAQTTVTVSGVFSSTYDSYRIVIAGAVVSADGSDFFYKQSGSTGSTYNYNTVYMSSGSTTLTGAQNTASSAGVKFGYGGTTFTAAVLDVHYPYQATRTVFTSQMMSNSYFAQCGGYDSNAASSTGFSIVIQSGQTVTGGTIMVYGYRVG